MSVCPAAFRVVVAVCLSVGLLLGQRVAASAHPGCNGYSFMCAPHTWCATAGCPKPSDAWLNVVQVLARWKLLTDQGCAVSQCFTAVWSPHLLACHVVRGHVCVVAGAFDKGYSALLSGGLSCLASFLATLLGPCRNDWLLSQGSLGFNRSCLVVERPMGLRRIMAYHTSKIGNMSLSQCQWVSHPPTPGGGGSQRCCVGVLLGGPNGCCWLPAVLHVGVWLSHAGAMHQGHEPSQLE